jgi:hypothetical protein
MNINWKRLFVGMSLISFTALTWIWMLGYLAVPPDVANNAPHLSNWSSPGLLSAPITISVIAGIAGTLFILFSIKVNEE